MNFFPKRESQRSEDETWSQTNIMKRNIITGCLSLLTTSAALFCAAVIPTPAAVAQTAAAPHTVATSATAAEVVSSDKQPVIMFRFMMLVWLQVSSSLRWLSRFGKKFIRW
jgi:hypothetical protein